MSERVLVVGETLVDVVADVSGATARYPGGSAANVALALARLERPVDLWTCLGDDADGRWLADELSGAGVRLVGDPWSLAATSWARATLDASGSATWTFDIDWAPRGEPSLEVAAVHTGSIASVLGAGADRVWEVLSRVPTTVLRSYDLNARTSVTGAGADVLDRVQRWLLWTDVVRASRADLLELWPDASAAETVRGWLAPGPVPTRPGTVVLSDGAAGAVRLSRYSRERFPAPEVEVVDTIGAGDTLTAAVLDGLLRHRGEMEDWRDLMTRAVRAASLSVTRAGCEPPSRVELDG